MASYRNYKHQDFSYLIKKDSVIGNNALDISENSKNVATENPFYNPEYDYKKFREDKLSNQSLKYVYSNITDIYHDRCCGKVKLLSNKEFEMTKEFSDNYNWCVDCYRFAVIRCGIQNDFSDFNKYVSYFKLVKANTDLLHLLIVENNAKISLVSDSVMEFEVKDDRWRVSKRNGILTLMHNNYFIDKSSRRVLENSFHIQMEKLENFKSCVTHMLNYSWDNHLKKFNERKLLEEKKKLIEEIAEQLAENGFIENYIPIKNHYIFSDKYMYLDNEHYSADRFFKNYNVKIKFLEEYVVPASTYRWIICKIPKRCFNNFSRAMRKTSKKMLKKRRLEYFDILKSMINFD